jgi:hypothetical protein
VRPVVLICIATLSSIGCSGAGQVGSMSAAGTVCGRVVDEKGAPRVGVACQLCSPEICLTQRTAADGRVCYTPTRAGAYYFHAASDDGLTYADVFLPFPLGDEVTAPGFSAAIGDSLTSVSVTERFMVTTAAGGTFNFAGGIELDIPAGALRFADLSKESAIAARAIDPTLVDARLLTTHAGTPESVYLLMPQGTTLKGGATAGLTLPNPTQLAEGTAVELALADDVTAHLGVTVQASVQGGKIVTSPMAGLPQLGWLAVYRK